MSRKIYPRPTKPLKRKVGNRRWRIEYDLNYDEGSSQWTGYYRTKIGAYIAALWNVGFMSWGGDVVLFDREADV